MLDREALREQFACRQNNFGGDLKAFLCKAAKGGDGINPQDLVRQLDQYNTEFFKFIDNMSKGDGGKYPSIEKMDEMFPSWRELPDDSTLPLWLLTQANDKKIAPWILTLELEKQIDQYNKEMQHGLPLTDHFIKSTKVLEGPMGDKFKDLFVQGFKNSSSSSSWAVAHENAQDMAFKAGVDLQIVSDQISYKDMSMQDIIKALVMSYLSMKRAEKICGQSSGCAGVKVLPLPQGMMGA